MEGLLQQIKSGEVAHSVPNDGLVATTYVTEDFVVQEASGIYGNRLLKGAAICDHLHRNGVAVPEVREVHEDPVYIVFERIPGTPLSDSGSFTQQEYVEAVRSAGEELARLHSVESFGYGNPDPEADFRSGSHDTWRAFAEQYVQNTVEYIENDMFKPIAENAAELVDLEAIPAKPEKRVLHMDYTKDNVIIDDDLNAHIIDLDNAYYGDERFDVMYTDLVLSKEPENISDAFWDGYRQVCDPSMVEDLKQTYRAMALLQDAKAGEWCSRNEKNLDFEEWRDGLQYRLDNEF